MSKLQTPDTGDSITYAFASLHSEHAEAEADFEHGRWWVHCHGCSAAWAVHGYVGGVTFEEVSHGDESCASLPQPEDVL